MIKVVKIQLGQGNLQQGFPHIVTTLSEKGLPPREWTASLPPAPKIHESYQRWRLLYETILSAINLSSRITIQEGAITHISDVEFQQLCQQLKQDFNNWLNSQDFLRGIYVPLCQSLQRDDEIQIIMQTPDMFIQELPWNQWKFLSDYPKAEIAFWLLESQVNSSSQTPLGLVRILAILGDSKNINLNQDKQLLKSLLNVDLQILDEPSRSEFNHHLWNPQGWDILFFAGHSGTIGQQGHISLNAKETLRIDDLKHGLERAISQGLQLAIFNSCDGLGLASELASLHIPQLIVMRYPVPDKVAQEFLKAFLKAFSRGISLPLAVREAREKLQAMEQECPCASWLPVICQNPAVTPPTWKNLQGTTLAHKLNTVFWSSIFCTTFILLLRGLGVLQGWELKLFDHFVRLSPPETIDKRILIVTIDEDDIQYQDQQKMKRTGSLSDRALNQLLIKVSPYRPRLIASDIFHNLPYESELLKTLKATPHFITICQINANDDIKTIPPPSPLPNSQLGFANFPLDPDGIVRRQLLGMSPDSSCNTQYSFSLQVALNYLSQEKKSYPESFPSDTYKIAETIFPQFTSTTGGYHLPAQEAQGYQILLNYRSANFESISLKKILEASNKVRLSQLISDRIILIGLDEEYKDSHLTPYSLGKPPQKMPGVIVQAHMISQLLSAVLDKRPLLQGWSIVWTIIWLESWAILGGIIWQLFYHTWQRILLLAITISILYFISILLFFQGYWIPFLPAVLLLILAFYTNSLYQTRLDKNILLNLFIKKP